MSVTGADPRENEGYAPEGMFAFTKIERVIFGPGCTETLGDMLAERMVKRAVVVTAKSLARSTLLESVIGRAGRWCVGTFSETAQHAPVETVRALTTELQRLEADAVISFGGGSVIDSAKVAVASLLNGRDMTTEAGVLRFADAFGVGDWGREILHVAIPTTLSAAEMTPAGGVTDLAARQKRGIVDSRLQPRVVIYDPELTRDTPERLWVTTGMRALDHAVEAIYSVRHQSFVDALATQAIKGLLSHLPSSLGPWSSARITHRGHCQIAAWCSLFGGFNTGLGISHAMGHKIGPKWDIPHGLTSCITLPHAMRYMATLVPERFAPIAAALGLEFDPSSPESAARACAQRVEQFILSFDVPHSLREMGVDRRTLLSIAPAIREEIDRFGSIGRAVSLYEIVGLLEAAYNTID